MAQPNQQQILDELSGRGPAPDAQAAPSNQAEATPPKDSTQDKAAEAGSPETEGDKSAKDPVVYDIQMGEQTRKMTPEQIAQTLQKYAQLNYKQTQFKPVIDTIGQYMATNPGVTPQQIAEGMKQFLAQSSGQKTMGDDGQPNRAGEPQGKPAEGQRSAEEISKALDKWEEENAASLPPGYREMLMGQNGGDQLAQLQTQLQQMQRMLQGVLASSAGTADAARQGMQQAQGQQAQAIKRQIATNLDRVQQHLGLPDEKANDFMVFAAERGYTLEDFIDPQVTIRVMTDFKNAMDSPEMERLRSIAQRRQAFTGAAGGTPSGQGAAAAAAAQPADGADPLAQMTEHLASKRMV